MQKCGLSEQRRNVLDMLLQTRRFAGLTSQYLSYEREIIDLKRDLVTPTTNIETHHNKFVSSFGVTEEIPSS